MFTKFSLKRSSLEAKINYFGHFYPAKSIQNPKSVIQMEHPTSLCKSANELFILVTVFQLWGLVSYVAPYSQTAVTQPRTIS